MRISFPIVLALALATVLGHAAPDDADGKAIRGAALDYIEGWYEGNADRMARALGEQRSHLALRAR